MSCSFFTLLSCHKNRLCLVLSLLYFLVISSVSESIPNNWYQSQVFSDDLGAMAEDGKVKIDKYKKKLYLPLAEKKPDAMDQAEWSLLDRQALGVTRLMLTKSVAYNIVSEKTTYGLIHEKAEKKPPDKEKTVLEGITDEDYAKSSENSGSTRSSESSGVGTDEKTVPITPVGAVTAQCYHEALQTDDPAEALQMDDPAEVLQTDDPAEALQTDDHADMLTMGVTTEKLELCIASTGLHC